LTLYSFVLWVLLLIARGGTFELTTNICPKDAPYISNMIDLTAISSKIWRIANFDPGRSAFNAKEMEELDFEVVQWYRNLALNLKFDPHRTTADNIKDTANFRLRVLLYLRANQTRILIGRPLFMSTSAIINNIDYAVTVINIAKDTIHILTNLNQTTPLYRSQQVLYNYFLMSALAALFLAVAHAPAQFSATCRDEFHMALDLVRGMSANSFIGRRLWRTIKVLKEVGPLIGMTRRNPEGGDMPDGHSSAAASMAGLAGHAMPMPIMGSSVAAAPGIPSTVGMGESWDGITSDLTNLFESAGGMPESNVRNGDGNGNGSFLAYQDGVAKVFRDMF
jgi:hypothetical protein